MKTSSSWDNWVSRTCTHMGNCYELWTVVCVCLRLSPSFLCQAGTRIVGGDMDCLLDLTEDTEMRAPWYSQEKMGGILTIYLSSIPLVKYEQISHCLKYFVRMVLMIQIRLDFRPSSLPTKGAWTTLLFMNHNNLCVVLTTFINVIVSSITLHQLILWHLCDCPPGEYECGGDGQSCCCGRQSAQYSSPDILVRVPAGWHAAGETPPETAPRSAQIHLSARLCAVVLWLWYCMWGLVVFDLLSLCYACLSYCRKLSMSSSRTFVVFGELSVSDFDCVLDLYIGGGTKWATPLTWLFVCVCISQQTQLQCSLSSSSWSRHPSLLWMNRTKCSLR